MNASIFPQHYHQGVLPARNAVMQFVGAAASLAFGLPVGREGPAIHLGAASASVIGRTLGLGHGPGRWP